MRIDSPNEARQRIATAQRLRRSLHDVRSVTLRSKREPSLNERNRVYTKYGTGLHKCIHNKFYHNPCTACKRDKRDADKNLAKLLARTT